MTDPLDTNQPKILVLLCNFLHLKQAVAGAQIFRDIRDPDEISSSAMFRLHQLPFALDLSCSFTQNFTMAFFLSSYQW